MEITDTLHVTERVAWRKWLQANHATAKEIWLILHNRQSDQPAIAYRDAVEEALCFGWIDGILKKIDDERRAQRFSPRRPNGNWTELNKERARRLIASGQMTPAGLAVLPDLSTDSFRIPADLLAAMQAEPQVWENFQRFPALYQRIRIGYIDDARSNPEVFQRRLANFLQKTRENKLFGALDEIQLDEPSGTAPHRSHEETAP